MTLEVAAKARTERPVFKGHPGMMRYGPSSGGTLNSTAWPTCPVLRAHSTVNFFAAVAVFTAQTQTSSKLVVPVTEVWITDPVAVVPVTETPRPPLLADRNRFVMIAMADS